MTVGPVVCGDAKMLRRFKLHFFRLVAFVGLLPVTAGCGGHHSSSGSSPANADKTIVNTNVRVLPANGTVTATLNGENLVLTGTPPKLSVGDVVVSPVGEGLLRKVSAVVSQGAASAEYVTTQGTLEDVFQQAHFKINQSQTPAIDHIDVNPDIPGLTITTGPRSRDVSQDGFSWPLHYTFTRSVIKSNNIDVELNGTLDGKLGIRFEWELDLLGRKYVKLEPFFTMEGDANVTAFATVPNVNFTARLGTIVPASVVIPVGPVPVVITPDIHMNLDLNGSVQGGVKIGVQASLDASAYLQFDSNDSDNGAHGFSWGGGVTPTFTPYINKYFTANGSLTYLKPEIGLKMYGVVGPYSILSLPQYKFKIDIVDDQLDPNNKKADVDIFATYQAGLGLRADIFWKNLFNFEKDDIFKKEVSVYHQRDDVPPGQGTSDDPGTVDVTVRGKKGGVK
jgi:hypothetical protein